MDEEYNNESTTAGTGTDSLLEKARRRSLGDIRIHDTEQAGELARRLGARAFTIGRDIYVRPELMKPGSPEGEALLAHEAYHVAEQTGAIKMPLLRPSTPALGGGGRESVSVQRIAASGASAATTAPASLPSSESQAESVESATQQSASGSGGGGGGGGSANQEAQQKAQTAKQHPQAEEVAERVYNMILMDLIIGGERHEW